MPHVLSRRPLAAVAVLLAAALAFLLAAYGRAPVVSDALAATTTLSFPATADAYVDQAAAGSNFGAATTLTADAGAGVAKNAYLRFQVSGVTGTVVSAKVHLFVSNGTANGPAIYPTGGPWTET